MELKPLTINELQLILPWRNHPDVRRVMFNDHEISWEEHLAWWQRLNNDTSRQVLLFCHDGHPVGVVNFFDIDTLQRTCHWGFYLYNTYCTKASERLAVWLGLEKTVIEYAFKTIRVRALYCETFEFNKPVLQLHRKFGFQEVDRFFREKNGKEESVVLMMLKNKASEFGIQPQSLRTVFLGSANWDIIGRDFAKKYVETTGEIAEVLFLPFGQYRQQVWDEDSLVATTELDYCIFAERFEDFFETPFSIFDLTQTAKLESRFEEYLQLLENARHRLSGTFLVLDLTPVRPFSTTLEDSAYCESTVRGFVSQLNARLEKVCERLSDCYLVRLSSLIETYGACAADPGKYWHLGRIAFNGGFGGELNLLLLKTILSLRGKTSRVVVVDLDNTLWGGVIGDDGLRGIGVGGDFPGNVFVEIQQTLKALRERGLALAICSKNTESVALEVFEKHPSMVLRLTDFVCRRINWKDKAENIREIAEEIGVGLSSICFLDDSPYEREAVRQMLPEVIVPEMPTDITQWPRFILSCPHLASRRLTQEDRERAKRYEIRARINHEAASYKNKEDYWKSLDMKLFFHRLSSANLQRTLQLLAKTNQFNMTTRRYTEKDLDRLVAESAEIIPIGLADKYSEHEIIGLVILLPSKESENEVVIDTFLLSCRVLGRSVETGILGWICAHIKKRDVGHLRGIFQPTPRNLPASGVYVAHGFEAVGSGGFQLDLKECSVAVPAWLQTIEDLK